MNWFLLIIAGLLEVVWALSMKYSQCFTRLYPSIITIVAMVVSFVLLALAMRSLPLGTSYVVWTGIGAIGSVVVGILFLGESAAIDLYWIDHGWNYRLKNFIRQIIKKIYEPWQVHKA